MSYLAIYNIATGIVVGVVPDDPAPELPEGFAAAPVDEPADPADLIWTGSGIADLRPRSARAMQHLAIYDTATGIVTGTISAETVGDAPAGYAYAPYEPVTDPRGMRWDGAVFVTVAPAVEEARAARWELVKARRDQAEWAGCNTALGRVDTDPDSQRKTGGAVQMAMIAQAAGQPFLIDWTMQDNSTAAHDAPAMIAMGVAVGMHVAACHEAALTKRAAIDAAGTVEAVEAVDLESGWPA